jgi:hypothetical protein
VKFETKIAVLLRDNLLPWQRLNVTAFTVSGIATLVGVIGRPYEDASGRTYLPMIRQPIVIFEVTGDQLRAAYEQALVAGAEMSIYTEELFSTNDDDANRAAVRAVQSSDLNLVGIAVCAARKTVEKLTKGRTLHP